MRTVYTMIFSRANPSKNGMPLPANLNTRISTKMHGMPAKDATTDAAAGFSSARKTHVYATSLTAPEKQWIGGVRDASEVTRQKKIAAMQSSFNPKGDTLSNMSQTSANTNDVTRAVRRTRSFGYMVPPKVGAINS